MDHAGFEEKQYESALQLDLAAGLPWCYPSGPVLEAVLGYDFAIDPGKRSVWEILGEQCPPGIVLTPGLWQPGLQPAAHRLPSRSVSLIIQTKRPVRLDHWRAGQDHFWRGPYFRFPLDNGQQIVLAQLESNASPQALVRYAAPAFLDYASLQRHQADRTVAEHSAFVSPATLSGHRVWTYDGPGAVGYANPNGETTTADTRDSLVGEAENVAVRQPLAQHILKLGAIARQVTEEIQFEVAATRRPLRYGPLDIPDLPAETTRLVQAWIDFASVVAWAGASWVVIGFD